MMIALMVLAALVFTIDNVSAADIDPNFNPFTTNPELQKDVVRLAELTTGTPITTLCVDATNTSYTGALLTMCKDSLAKELVVLQNKLVDNFFTAVVEQFKVLGSPFDKNKIISFDNNAECQREINVFSQLAAADATLCKNMCANVKLAAPCLHGKVRDLLRTEQTKAAGDVNTALNSLDRAQLPVFDKVFAAAEQAKFLDISEDADRLKQSIAGLILGQISQTAIELEKGNYVTYNDKVVAQADVEPEVAKILALAKIELAKDARITDALKRLNALDPKQETAAIVKGAFDLAAKRVEKVENPVAIHARISNLAAADEKAVTDDFKAVLGPETFFGKSKDDAKNAGKKQIDVAMGVEQGEIGTQDTEFSIQCVKSQVNCEILEDVHKTTFDLVQANVHSETTAPNLETTASNLETTASNSDSETIAPTTMVGTTTFAGTGAATETDHLSSSSIEKQQQQTNGADPDTGNWIVPVASVVAALLFIGIVPPDAH